MELLLIILVAAIIGVAAQLWGVDETDGSPDPRRSVRPAGISRLAQSRRRSSRYTPTLRSARGAQAAG